MSAKKDYKVIFQDGLVLVLASTLFVVILNSGFKLVKKDVALDPIVTAIRQNVKEDALTILKSATDQNRANMKDEFGRTPLMMASYANYNDEKRVIESDDKGVEWVNLLKENGADISLKDNNGWNALMWASWSGLTKVATQLVQLGIDVKDVDSKGNNALMLASARGNLVIVQNLVSVGVDKSAVNLDGKTALDLAKTGKDQHPDKAELFEQIIQLL